MEEKEYGAFLVVKILSPNPNNFGKCECVPHSWVKAKHNIKNIVVFGYPLEERLKIILRIIEEEPLDTTWPTLFGEVVFHTGSQEDAFEFIKKNTTEHQHNSDQLQDMSKQDAKNVEVEALNTVRIKPDKTTPKNNNRPPKRRRSDVENNPQLDNKLEFEILEANNLIQTYTRDLDNRTPVSSLNSTQRLDTPEMLPIETVIATEIIPINNERAAKITERPRRKSTRQTTNLSQDYKELSDEDFYMSDDSECAPKIVNPDRNSRVSNSLNPKTSVPSLDQDINLNLTNEQVYSYCYNFNVEFNESYQKTMSILDNAADYLQKVIATHKDNLAAKAKHSSQSPTNQGPVAINSNIFAHPQPLLQERLSVSDEDSKWTLRYPDPGLGIIELLPNTGVYVSENGLEECKTCYNETTTLTRGLLEEVFTDEALKMCSYKGNFRKKMRKNSTTIKPSLDSTGRDTLIAYVLQYALEKGWKKANSETIICCIKNRLQRLNRLG